MNSAHLNHPHTNLDRSTKSVGTVSHAHLTTPSRPLPISMNDVAHLAQMWRPEARLHAVLGSWENFVFELIKGDERVILRMTEDHRRSKDEVGAELNLVNSLASNGLRVPRVLSFADGRQIVSFTHDGTTYWCCLFGKISGEQMSASSVLASEASIESWGELIGRLHISMSVSSTSGLPRPFWRDNPLLRTALRDHRNETVLSETVDSIVSELSSLSVARDDFGLVHGDLHGRNVLQSRKGDLAIIDFDDCSYHWYLYDVAVSLVWLFRSGGEYDRVRDSLLRGYKRQRPAYRYADRLIDQLAFLRNALDHALAMHHYRRDPISFSSLRGRAMKLEHYLQLQMSYVLN